MIFSTTDGSEYSISSSNLQIKFTSDKLVATSDGNTLEVPLAKLKTMQFSEKQSGIDGTVIDTPTQLTVYGIDGTVKGIFDSVESASAKLDNGVYILKDKNGLSIKIAVRK